MFKCFHYFQKIEFEFTPKKNQSQIDASHCVFHNYLQYR